MGSKNGKRQGLHIVLRSKNYSYASSKLDFVFYLSSFSICTCSLLNWVSRLGGRPCPRRPRAEKQRVLGESSRSSPGNKIQRVGGRVGEGILQGKKQKTKSSREEPGRTNGIGAEEGVISINAGDCLKLGTCDLMRWNEMALDLDLGSNLA